MNPYCFTGDRETNLRYQAKYALLFKPGERVLDLGCGECVFLELLRDRDIHGVGVDAFLDAVSEGRAKGLDVRYGDAAAFVTATDERFDGIFMAHLIEHISCDQIEGLLRGCHKILRPGGRMIIITPNTFDLAVLTERFWLDLTHKWPYPPRLLQALVAILGFTIVSIGDDPDTPLDPKGFDFRTRVRFWINKMRFGEYFGRGDTVLIARKES